MSWLPCPFLGADVEWTDERERHVAEQHPDLLPAHRAKVMQTLSDPDEIRHSARFNSARLFSRWYADLRDGKHVVVVVVSGHPDDARHWVITAYISRRLSGGGVEWSRS